MTNRKGGYRRKTRHKIAKKPGTNGKLSIARYLAEFSPGQRVMLALEASYHKGMFHPRFQGRGGVVDSKTGDCYRVTIKDLSKKKTLVVHPVHLLRQ
ncbi:50S ribosomal protein L21e [Candidatus Woesearchaeota archaeon]|nr:50S ribosomal protein L21e [Candidatus Woesearchaeota archaeon]